MKVNDIVAFKEGLAKVGILPTKANLMQMVQKIRSFKNDNFYYQGLHIWRSKYGYRFKTLTEHQDDLRKELLAKEVKAEAIQKKKSKQKDFKPKFSPFKKDPHF